MTVYVDPLFTMQPRTAQARSHGNEWCHMQVGKGDDLEELHLMAEKIGLKRSYFQAHRLYPHYDLTPAKRAMALDNGAVELDHAKRRKTCCRVPALANWTPKGSGENLRSLSDVMDTESTRIYLDDERD